MYWQYLEKYSGYQISKEKLFFPNPQNSMHEENLQINFKINIKHAVFFILAVGQNSV